MWNKPTLKYLSKLPKLGAQDGNHTKEVTIYAHFFMGDCDWYISEFDGKDEFFGFVILNGDYEMAEWGSISFKELYELKFYFIEVDFDLYWTPKKVKEINKIVEARGSW